MLQLLYVSKAAHDLPKAELRAILDASHGNNAKLGITGLLLARSTLFVQLLEGRGVFVEELVRKIEKDPRHGDVRVLLKGETEKRFFADWQMGFIADADVDVDVQIPEIVPLLREAYRSSEETGDRMLAVLKVFAASRRLKAGV